MKRLAFILLLLCATIASAQWKRCENGLDGGMVVSLYSLGDRILAASNRGVYFTTNLGDQWNRSPGDDFGVLSVTKVYQFLSFKGKAYAATDNGLYYSTDNGDNWLITNFGYERVNSIAANDDFIFGGNLLGEIKRSSDEGKTWEVINGSLPNSVVHKLAVYNNNLFVGGQFGLHKSVDNGATWTTDTIKGSTVKKIVLLKAVKGHLFVGLTNFTNSSNQLFVSSDGGVNWIPTDTHLGTDVIADIDADDNFYFAATSRGVMRSTMPDSLWNNVATGFTRYQTQGLCVVGGSLLAGTKDGVYLSSDDGNSWVRKSVGLRNIVVTKIHSDDNGLFAGCSNAGIYYSADNGENWRASDTKLDYVRALKGFGKDVYASGEYQLLRWNGDDKSWKEINEKTNTILTTCFAINDEEIYAGGPYGTIRSTNRGDVWEKTNMPTDISCLEIKDGIIIAGSSEKAKIIRSDNKGFTWNEQYVDPNPYIEVQTILIKDGDMFVGTDDGLYFSSDDGANWEVLQSGLLNDNFLTLAANGNHLFAGTMGGIYHSSDKGKNWTDVTGNLPFGVIPIISAYGEYVFVSDYSFGFYRAKIEDLFNISAPETPTEFPTILSPTPAIDYVVLPETDMGLQEANVYSILGVKVLSDKPKSGKLFIGKLPAGIYILDFGGKRFKFVKK